MVTRERLHKLRACVTGYRRFISMYPKGVSYEEVLRRYGPASESSDLGIDRAWMQDHLYGSLRDEPQDIAGLVSAELSHAGVVAKQAKGSPSGMTLGNDETVPAKASSGSGCVAGNAGEYSNSAAAGFRARAIAQGHKSTAIAAGPRSKAISSGPRSNVSAVGEESIAATADEGSLACSAGVSSVALAAGEGSAAVCAGPQSSAGVGQSGIAMVAGSHGIAKAGENGAFALAWHDGTRSRIAVGLVGEADIKADCWYSVNSSGKLVEMDRGYEPEKALLQTVDEVDSGNDDDDSQPSKVKEAQSPATSSPEAQPN